MHETEVVIEARRAMEICNACRYCEGYCAVFPAMTERREFSLADLGYLANLCHGCKGCYHACQFAPPHPFGVNVPKAFAELRNETYETYAWPAGFGKAFRRNGTILALLTALALAGVLLLTALLSPRGALGQAHQGAGAFYAVIPWGVMTAIAGVTFLFSLLALAMGGLGFWRDQFPRGTTVPGLRNWKQAFANALSLRNLGGGGHGCNDLDESFSQARRHFHHAMFYGFLLCFGSTSTATVYDHFLQLQAPYPVMSLPVLLGIAGGIGLIIGTAGLMAIKAITDPAPVARRLAGSEYALLSLLFAVAFSGMVLLVLRGTAAMPVLLCLHLGLVLAFFLLLPYSKMVHGLYRGLALLKAACERPRG